MALTGAQRVERHRVKQRDRIAELELANEKLKDRVAELELAHEETKDRLRQVIVDEFWLAQELQNQRVYSKGLRTRIDRLTKWHEFNNVLGALGNDDEPPVDWEYLSGLDDIDLRKWVKIGARVDKQPGDTNPMHTATEWIKGNDPSEFRPPQLG